MPDKAALREISLAAGKAETWGLRGIMLRGTSTFDWQYGVLLLSHSSIQRDEWTGKVLKV